MCVGGGGGLKFIYWYKIVSLDSTVTVVEAQNMISLLGGFQAFAMHHYRNNLIKLTHYDKTKKRAHDSQIVRAEDNLFNSASLPNAESFSQNYTIFQQIYFREVSVSTIYHQSSELIF